MKSRRLLINILAVAGAVALLGATSATAARLVTGKQIRNGSITGVDVKNRSLTAADFTSGTATDLSGEKGEQGDPGPAGPAGPAGPPGPSEVGKIVRVEQRGFVAPDDVNGPMAVCPAGYSIVSGGYKSAGAGVVFTSDSFGGPTWAVGYDNIGSTVTADVTAIAYCAPSGKAVAAASVRSKSRSRFETVLDRQRAAHK
jgi:hypothetical protein